MKRKRKGKEKGNDFIAGCFDLTMADYSRGNPGMDESHK
jgi:hypothetical protein